MVALDRRLTTRQEVQQVGVEVKFYGDGSFGDGSDGDDVGDGDDDVDLDQLRLSRVRGHRILHRSPSPLLFA